MRYISIICAHFYPARCAPEHYFPFLACFLANEVLFWLYSRDIILDKAAIFLLMLFQTISRLRNHSSHHRDRRNKVAKSHIFI